MLSPPQLVLTMSFPFVWLLVVSGITDKVMVDFHEIRVLGRFWTRRELLNFGSDLEHILGICSGVHR